MCVCFISTFAVGTAFRGCARAISVVVISGTAFGAEIVGLCAVFSDVMLKCVAFVAYE